MTQKEVALACDIEISQVSRIERGLVNPTLNTLMVLNAASKCSFSELLDFK